MEVGFSINQYDNEGDAWDSCVLIHLNKDTILRFKNIDEIKGFVEDVNLCLEEIKETGAYE